MDGAIRKQPFDVIVGKGRTYDNLQSTLDYRSKFTVIEGGKDPLENIMESAAFYTPVHHLKVEYVPRRGKKYQKSEQRHCLDRAIGIFIGAGYRFHRDVPFEKDLSEIVMYLCHLHSKVGASEVMICPKVSSPTDKISTYAVYIKTNPTGPRPIPPKGAA